MKKVFLTGSSQINHIAELLSKHGYETRTLVCDNGKISSLLKYYWRYIRELRKTPQVYIVYAMPNHSIMLTLARVFGKKVILHWIGTDVYNYIHSADSPKPYTGKVSHVTGSQLLHDELEAAGIQSDIIPIIPFGMKLELMEMPDKHAALVYLPKGREDFYRGDIVRELAVRNPDIDFHIVANDQYNPLDLPNVVFHGKLDSEKMNALYRQISVLVRLPEHDGLSMMVIEALAKGKQVLYRYEHPYVYTPDSMEMDDIDTKFKEIVSERPKQNKQGHDYILEQYTEEQMMKWYEMYRIFD
ncbi:MAG: hypothetical protein NC300_02130 [Bacteroidales bacterium]|nr:hypothetical protein [Clostridium sp.]MCM1202923.1 hypothetical protein [Bacteroidales bacterium]